MIGFWRAFAFRNLPTQGEVLKFEAIPSANNQGVAI
jgi:hypothetical protein